MNRHEKRNRIANFVARQRGLMDYRPERVSLPPIADPNQPRLRGNTPLVLVREVRIDGVIRRQFAPLSAVAGLIADAIAKEKANGNAPSVSPTTSAATTPTKPNGHKKATTSTSRPIIVVSALLSESAPTLHHNPITRVHSREGYWHIEPDSDGDSGGHPAVRSWKRYRAKQWRGGNRWSCRQEMLAAAR